jgi:peptide/nickel transport system substrate-binding protein
MVHMKVSSRLGRAHRRPLRLVAGFAALALLASACGDEGAEPTTKEDVKAGINEESGLAEAGKPVRGGRIVYGIEAESSGGWCLPESQLAASGNLIAGALYDTLTRLDDNSNAKPFLAKSVDANDEHTEFTIVLRAGVTFHDGSDLDAAVVKNNIDALLGRYPPRKPSLWPLILANVDTVTVEDDLTVVVTTKTPWVLFPNYLAALGIMGQAQLDDEDSCDTNLIGTGPFELAEWVPDQQLLAQRNDDYWLIAPDGKPYPYADAVEFRPISEAISRINALEAGEVNVIHATDPADIYGTLTDLRNEGTVNLLASDRHAEVGYVMLNNSKAPFNDERMRRALAMAVDREADNDLLNDGQGIIADQPFPPGDPGYVEDLDFPDHDPEAAKALVAEYEAEGNSATFTLNASAEPTILARAQVVQNHMKKIGVDVTIHSVDQATLISEAIAGSFQAVLWRQHAGGNPDGQYIWWHGPPNPTNFARIDDDVIDKALEDGRVEPDPEKRRELYEGISRRFAEKVYNVWATYSVWGIAMSPNVHGVHNMDLPEDGGEVFTGLAAGHPLHGMWISN